MAGLYLLVHTARETKAVTATTSAIKALADFQFTAGLAEIVKRLTITAGANALRVTWSGTDPTSALGHHVPANGNLTIDGNVNCQQVKILSLVGDSAVTATLEV